ncbi:response regulator [Endothiovibrio diazotrophicus]
MLEGTYRLTFATGGIEAIEVAARVKPSLILLDIQMPDMDGYQVCTHLKRHPATEHIPVIFVTSLTEVGEEAEGFAAGAVDYITKPLSPPIVQARVRNHLSLVKASRLERSYHDALSMLGTAGHYNDTDTGVHIWRMAAYTRALAAASGWPEEACRTLEAAAPMHDTGKIGIPGAILRKPGKLDADEWTLMKSHTTIGYDILSQSDAPVFKIAAEVALRHHEKWDGSGYPSGLSGKAIPECARIVAIADVFDALTMKRPYKEAWPIERTMATMAEGAASHFDPRLLAAFQSILPEILGIKAQWDAKEAF